MFFRINESHGLIIPRADECLTNGDDKMKANDGRPVPLAANKSIDQRNHRLVDTDETSIQWVTDSQVIPSFSPAQDVDHLKHRESRRPQTYEQSQQSRALINQEQYNMIDSDGTIIPWVTESSEKMEYLTGADKTSDEKDRKVVREFHGLLRGRSMPINQERYELIDTDGTKIPWASDITLSPEM